MALYERLANDMDFRSKMKSDPRAALAEEGAKLPESVNIEVVESTGDTVYIALPPLNTNALSEEELEGVTGAGGINIGGGGSVGFPGFGGGGSGGINIGIDW